MKGFNSNISSLFSSLGTSSPINFSDYAAIKNGSYGKLAKAYYAKQKDTDTVEKTSSKVSTKAKAKTDVDTTGLSKMKKDADSLKSAAETLNDNNLWKKTDGKADMEKIASAVSDFAKEYNDTINQVSKVSSKEVAQSAKYMTSMTGTMSNALSKIGISVGNDGKLSVDEDALKKSDVNKIQALFSGNNSYGMQIAKDANEISKATVMNTGTYAEDGSLTSTLSGLFNSWV